MLSSVASSVMAVDSPTTPITQSSVYSDQGSTVAEQPDVFDEQAESWMQSVDALMMEEETAFGFIPDKMMMHAEKSCGWSSTVSDSEPPFQQSYFPGAFPAANVSVPFEVGAAYKKGKPYLCHNVYGEPHLTSQVARALADVYGEPHLTPQVARAQASQICCYKTAAPWSLESVLKPGPQL